jgi:adenosylcobinamide kinase/adenosylcobinamide-phosphate guanylyltransferase
LITLVLGGARSGKSTYAEHLMAHLPPPITYVATLQLGDDQDLADRVARHRERRPAEWYTAEAGLDLDSVLRSLSGSVLLDSLGPWVALHGDDDVVDSVALCRALTARIGRHFRDALGTLNQEVAAVADEVLLIVAGRVLPLHAAP